MHKLFNSLKDNKVRKTLAFMLGFFTFLIFAYLIVLPIYPIIKYEFFIKKDYQTNKNTNTLTTSSSTPEEYVIEIGTTSDTHHLQQTDYSVSDDRLIIKKIGVNTAMVKTENPDYGLSLGAWLDPRTSTPGHGGNTVISGHRFKYLPPSNLTFYLLDKINNDDTIEIIWKKKKYIYQVFNTKIVEASDLSILEQDKDDIITLYTCHPIYSQEKRLVVQAKLIK